jgi:UDPglucose 6-dehydrogenase
MKIGFIGLGKLGYPVATAMAYAGHDVLGYDIDPANMTYDPRPYQETGPDGIVDFNDFVTSNFASFDGERLGVADGSGGSLSFGTMAEVASHSEVIFVAVQTPHDPEYEGVTPMPPSRKDFDYSFIKEACAKLAYDLVHIHEAAYASDDESWTPPTVAIISTMLPGTMRREILPVMGDLIPVIYNPAFIAMGTTWRDFIDPEFVLIGAAESFPGCDAAELVQKAHSQCMIRKNKSPYNQAPFHHCSIESAELTKVAYNTFIGMKISFANTIMEICHGIKDADCDQVIDGLSLAHRRIISPAYLRGGMGDGGGCHPRDNIAMSWLASKLDLSTDIFSDIMTQREEQTEWLADLAKSEQKQHPLLPFVLLGEAFKPGTNITVGSPARLLSHYLPTALIYDPFTGENNPGLMDSPAIFIISTKHPEWAEWDFPRGSIVIDPHRYIPDHPEYNVIRLGEA